jgi:hypothetical protein
MTATIVELRPGDLHRKAVDQNLERRLLVASPMTAEHVAHADEAYRNSAPRFKCFAWIAYFILCIVSWWVIVKLILAGWNLITL